MELHINVLLIHKVLFRSIWIATGRAHVKKSQFNKAVERFQARLKYLSVMRRGKLFERMIHSAGDIKQRLQCSMSSVFYLMSFKGAVAALLKNVVCLFLEIMHSSQFCSFSSFVP